MTRDDRPMLRGLANQLDLELRYGGIPNPTHAVTCAMVSWWHFIAKRKALVGGVRP